MYCFKIHNVSHSRFVVSDSIRYWRLLVSEITVTFLRMLFCTYLAQIVISLITFV